MVHGGNVRAHSVLCSAHEKRSRTLLDVSCYLLSRFVLQVHVNGFVSLGSPPYPPYPAWYPYLYPYFSRWYSVIAPFWTDIDLSWTDGVIYLGHISRYSEDEHVTPRETEVFEAVQQLVGDAGFLPTQVITVTWLDVSPYPGWWYHTQVHTCAFDTM